MKLASVEIFYIMAIYPAGAAVYIIETHKQLDHGGFSSTGRTNDGDLLAIFDLCGKVMDNDLLRIVAKAYVVKFYISVQSVNGNSVLSGGFLFLLIQELKHTLGSGC